MLYLAKRMVQSAFGIGVAIGLVVNLLLLPAVVDARRPDPPCIDASGQPPEVVAYADMLCTVEQAVFADAVQAGLAFKLDADVTQPGKYRAQDWLGRDVTLAASYVVSPDLKSLAPELYGLGFVVRYVFGTLVGPGGSTPIMGLSMLPKGVTADEDFVFLPMAIPSAAELDLYAQASRINAGVRVLDVNTFRSYPLEEVVHVEQLSGSNQDLATLYGSAVNNGQTSGGVDPNCVARAYAAYNIAMNAALLTLANCTTGVVKAWALAMAFCLASSLLLPFLGSTICAVTATAAMLNLLSVCNGAFANTSSAARQQLVLALQACGVSIAVQ